MKDELTSLSSLDKARGAEKHGRSPRAAAETGGLRKARALRCTDEAFWSSGCEEESFDWGARSNVACRILGVPFLDG